MKLDIRTVSEDSPLSFRHEMNLSDLRFADRAIYASPIVIEGTVRKTAAGTRLEACWHTVLSLCCDRCALEFSRNEAGSLAVTLVSEAPREERDDLYVTENGLCDLDELLRPVFILLPPQKTLCRDDCAGLCPHCGQNRNELSCDCGKRETDPRLEALRAFLDD